MTDRDNITLPREVAELALEVVELALKVVELSSGGEPIGTMEREAIAALRAALAAEQPKQEPVAWQCREHGDDEWFDCSKEAYGINPSRYVYRCLYAAPPEDEALRRDAEKWRKAQAKYIAWQKGGKAEAMGDKR